MKLDNALTGVSRLAFDTAPIIYFIEANPKYVSLINEIFNRVDAGLIQGVTSVITLAEVLVHPISRGQSELGENYRELLQQSGNFHTAPITVTIAEAAASIRATYGLRLADAMQIATAIESDCEAFVCNDRAMRRVRELRVLILDELEW